MNRPEAHRPFSLAPCPECDRYTHARDCSFEPDNKRRREAEEVALRHAVEVVARIAGWDVDATREAIEAIVAVVRADA